MFPSDAKTIIGASSRGATNSILDVPEGENWTVLDLQIWANSTNAISLSTEADLGRITFDGSELLNLVVKPELNDPTASHASLYENTGHLPLVYELYYSEEEPLSFTSSDNIGQDFEWHYSVTYIEHPYASSTIETVQGYDGPNISEWSFGVGVTIFFLSLMAWRYIFRPAKELFKD